MARHDLFACRIGEETPVAARAGQDVQVVKLEPVRRAAGVMAARDANHIAIADRHRLAERTILGTDPRHGPALCRVQPVIICLFELGDAGEVALVVAITRG